MSDKIIQVSGFQYGPPEQYTYMLVGVTESGAVVMSTGAGNWADVSPHGHSISDQLTTSTQGD